MRNARVTWRDVGAQVGLSANAVAQRVRRLEDDGWVRGYTALLDPQLDGGTSSALVLLRTATDTVAAEIEAYAVTQALALRAQWAYVPPLTTSAARDRYCAAAEQGG